MDYQSPKIPSPGDLDKGPDSELIAARDKVLNQLIPELTKRKRGDKGDNPIYTNHVDQKVKQAVIEALEGQNWTVEVKKIYGGNLHWYIRPRSV